MKIEVVKQHILEEVKRLPGTTDERGQLNVLGGAVLAIVTAAILMMLGAYILSKLDASLNDSEVTVIKSDVVTGFQDAADFPGLVLIFIFIGVILAVINNLGNR